MEKKKWSKISTPWAFVDAILNQLTVVRVTRPWDYSILVVVRALHCARWLGEVEQDEGKQTELLLQYYLDVMEKNINKARYRDKLASFLLLNCAHRASKPPCTFEEAWSVLRHTVQRAQKSPGEGGGYYNKQWLFNMCPVRLADEWELLQRSEQEPAVKV